MISKLMHEFALPTGHVCGKHMSLDMATAYRLHNSEIRGSSLEGHEFSTIVYTGFEVHVTSSPMGAGDSYPGVKRRQRRAADHSDQLLGPIHPRPQFVIHGVLLD
jgi:hypothetical protein